MKKIIFLVAVFSVYFIVALYKIDQIPGEWFGDISIVHEYTQRVIQGKLPLYYEAGGGPLYHYLISPFIKITGMYFINYKSASVLTGFLGILLIYLLVAELTNQKIALLTSGLTVVFFDYIVWERIGNYNIIIPAISAVSLWLLVLYDKSRKILYLILGAFVSSLGLLVHPSIFILPVVYLLAFSLFFLKRERISTIGYYLLAILFSFLPATVIFSYIVSQQPDHFIHGYIGSKIFNDKLLSIPLLMSTFIQNIIKTAFMFHVKGDITFRYNLSQSPLFDLVSGIYFIIGIVFLALKERRKIFWLILFFLSTLIVPSLLPTLPPIEVPSFERSMAIIPIVMFLVSYGCWNLYNLLCKYNKALTLFIFLLSFTAIAYLNIRKYFILYPLNLPNHNVAFGKIIANYIDTLPIDSVVHLTSCCWAQWGMPEPKAIYYVLKNKEGRDNIITANAFTTDCNNIEVPKSNVFIFNPEDYLLIGRFKRCFPEGKFSEFSASDGQRVFSSLYLKRSEM